LSKAKALYRALILIILVNIFSCLGHAKRPIVIGSKKFSESIIIAEMVSILLEEKYQTSVVRKFSLGGTKVAFDALKLGAIDIYPDYTGTGYVMILKMDGERDPQKVHQIVSREFKSRYGILWSKKIGFNNTYALAVRGDDQRFKNIDRLGQLSGIVESYQFASPHEFMERKDGFDRFSKTYNLNFQKDHILSIESGLMYAAIHNKQTDMIIAYSTDGRIKAYNLKIIKDDLNYFPPYQAALLANKKSTESFPEIMKAFSEFENLISENEMVEMNDQVDRFKKAPYDVARNFLIKKNLISGKIVNKTEESNLFKYFYSKKDYLLKLLLEHLLLSFGALGMALLVSIPIGISLTRHESLAKVVFPIINTIQTIPSLALLGFLIPIMGIGFAPALIALFLYSLLPIIRNTYSGIKGVDKNYIEVSKGIGLTGTQILLKVEIPLALPIILAGLRTAAVIVIGTATLAALIGAGGFGDPIFRGVATVNSNLILLGAIPSALLAIFTDKCIGQCEKIFVSKGIRLKN
jgi:osmoprotectant transport system permease protein